MPVIANGDVLRVDARMSYPYAGLIVNSYTVRVVSGAPIDADDFAADMGAWLELIYTPLLPAMSMLMDFDDINIFNYTQEWPLGSFGWPTIQYGSHAGEMLPSGVAALAIARTDRTKVQGRKFFGPLSEASQGAGEWVTSFMTSFATAAANWVVSEITGVFGTYTPGVWNRDAEIFRAFVEGVVFGVARYQRRRRAGVGA
jgi:hypothetical protein